MECTGPRQQFYTTNHEYILTGLHVPEFVTKVIEPFCGRGHLVSGLSGKTLELYDIDPKYPNTVQRDTLLHPPDYSNAFVVTNPPYLARNKSQNKTYFIMYKTDDLYKCFINQLCESPKCQGAIVVIPVNFFCSIRAGDIGLRARFFDTYTVERINIFEEQVFEDTRYSVCSFLCINKRFSRNTVSSVNIFPGGQTLNVSFREDNSWSIGAEVHYPISSRYTVTRATTDTDPNTRILINCIDSPVKLDGTQTELINAKIVEPHELYIDTTEKGTARSFLSLRIEPELTLSQQEALVIRFNQYLSEKRRQYNSMFLVNYREGSRKRISFDLVYTIVKKVINSLGL